MTMLFIGGYTTAWGLLVSVPVLWGVPLLLPQEVQSWRVAMYGVALLAVVLLRPQGFVTRETLRATGRRFSIRTRDGG
jgi:branched-chain amino acid transport system permease protein